MSFINTIYRQRSTLRILSTRFLSIRNKQSDTSNRNTKIVVMADPLSLVNPNIFAGVSDRFKGVTVNSETEDNETKIFIIKLEESLKHWIANKTRAVWFKVAIKHSEWVPILVQNGFDFHHANNGYVMMYRWLSPDEPDRIPPYAHTMIGCGAIVINSKNQVLLVKEKHFFIPKYKFPGGYVDRGENLVAAAQREVLEETNIQTEFKSVVCFRHSHNANFNSSDLYFIAQLNALNEDIKIDNIEIVDALWLDADKIDSSELVSDHNKIIWNKYLENQSDDIAIDFSGHTVELLNKPYLLYTVGKNKL